MVPEGDFFALLGPNGAGKSTLIGIVTSLVNKTSGAVRVFGHDLDREPEAVKASLGVVPQEFNFNLFLPVAEVVINQAGYFGIPRREAKVHAEFLLRKLDLWDRRRSETRLLSGGMKRRLMIARALVHRPRLLILDEPTAGVDIEIRRAMWDHLRELNAEGTTIILTTHYLEEAESLCRHIAVIDHGRIGVFYSIDLLPEFWQQVSLANPVLYMVNAFRYGLLGLHRHTAGLCLRDHPDVHRGARRFALWLLHRGIGIKT
jgi:ABC-2 type transport system ATP-binding protein